MIYFIQSLNAPYLVKIGFTSRDPFIRMRSVESAHRVKTQMLGVMDGGLADERALHTKFSKLRAAAEWFMPDAELLSFVDDNTAFPDEDMSESPLRRKPVGVDGKKDVHLYISPALYDRLLARARSCRVSLSKQVEVMLEDAEKRSAKASA